MATRDTESVAPVSVVIPALNAEPFIAEAIESVRAQTMRIAELIVVDNGCSDRTAQIASDLGAIVVQQHKRGLSPARNAGIQRSTQPWVALLDADDLWDREKTERQWAAVQACPDAGLISSYRRVFQGEVTIIEQSDEEARERWAGYQGQVMIGDHCRYFPKVEADFFPRFLPSCSDAMLRRDVFATVGMFDEDVLYNEDFEFFLRVLARYPLAIVEKPLISCRHHDQKHSFNLEGMRNSLLAVINHMFMHPDKYPAGAPQVYRDRIKKNFVVTQRALEEYRSKAKRVDLDQ